MITLKQYIRRFGDFETFDIDCQILFLCYFHYTLRQQDKIDPYDIIRYFDELQIDHHSIVDILASLTVESRVPDNTLCKKYYWKNNKGSDDCYYYIRPLVNKNLKDVFKELGYKD